MALNLLTKIEPAQMQSVAPTAVEAWLHQFDAPLRHTALTPEERRALAEFLSVLDQQYRDDIEAVILYGSAARGEARGESDVDLLLLARRTLSKEEQITLRDLGIRTGDHHHCELNVLVMTPDEQQWHGRGSSLWRNIQRDGIVVWPRLPAQVRLDARFIYRKNPASGAYSMTEAQYDEIPIYLENCAEELAAAEVLIQSGMARLAISRCYYAIFYATTALLLTKGVIRARHGGTRGALSEFFIRSGEIPKEMGDLYTLLQGEREMADYKLSVDPPWEDVVEARLEGAKEFVATVRDYLVRNNYLSA